MNPCPKPVKFRSEPYRAYIRSLPCCVCGVQPCGVAHHESVLNDKGMGSKPGDEQCIGLCPRCHTLLHSGDNWTRIHMPKDPEKVMLKQLAMWLAQKEGK
jgi:hypothetical protein